MSSDTVPEVKSELSQLLSKLPTEVTIDGKVYPIRRYVLSEVLREYKLSEYFIRDTLPEVIAIFEDSKKNLLKVEKVAQGMVNHEGIFINSDEIAELISMYDDHEQIFENCPALMALMLTASDKESSNKGTELLTQTLKEISFEVLPLLEPDRIFMVLSLKEALKEGAHQLTLTPEMEKLQGKWIVHEGQVLGEVSLKGKKIDAFESRILGSISS